MKIDSSFLDSIHEGMNTWNVPGVSIAIFSEKECLKSYHLGLASHNSNEKITHKSVFPIASLTKSFTAGTLGLLVDQGKIKFTDPVIQHNKDFELCDPYLTKECQIQDLLLHRIGYPSQALTSMATWGYKGHDLTNALKYLKPIHSFRSRYGYINVTFAQLQHLFPLLINQTWQHFIKESIFNPLGMTQTYADKDSLFQNNNLVSGHCLTGENIDTIQMINFHQDPGAFGCAGGLYSTAEDLGHWLQLFINRGHYGSDQKLFEEKTIKHILTPQIYIQPDEFYALGWCVSYGYPSKVNYHLGALASCSTYMGFCPDLKIGIVILSNQGQSNYAASQSRYFWDMVFRKPKHDYHGVNKKLYLEDHTRVLDSQKDHENPEFPSPLDKYTGKYWNDILGEVSISEKPGQGLMFKLPTGVEASLKHYDRDIFVLFFKGEMEKKGQSRWGKAIFSTPQKGEFKEFQLVKEGLLANNDRFSFARLIY